MATPESTEPAASRDVLADVERAIAQLERHADPTVRDAVATALQGIDAVHRTGLTHLVHALHAIAGDTVINRLVADPAIRMLLMSYDLIAIDRRVQAEEALDTVRGHLHDYGVDVEMQDVVGGVVYVRLHVSPRAGREIPSLAAVRADLEAALRQHLIGFQELECGDRTAHAALAAVVPLQALRRANRPVYEDALADVDLQEGTMRAVIVHGLPVLVARVAGEVYAIRNQCADSPLPLDMGTLDGAEVRCPWHGCRYDVRSGRRLDGDARVPVLPVTTEAGRILVAVDVAGEGR